ncbi:hypothetical protein MLD38_020314 [Melastoma candidum]|uniref:Uncharacterized protein n=1 Tax=Melastoma candidum TaxID=119954 RepID=A0ACB9QC01_9MYRT|nr:hypothetical protein MLD38_020314 [Melastoma candidum]
MLGKKIGSFKRLAKTAKSRSIVSNDDDSSARQELLLSGCHDQLEDPSQGTPKGFFPVYVGEERRRFVVPTGHLSHPLFRMLLEKARDEFGFDQRDGLAVPCSVNAFQEALAAIESGNGGFDFSRVVHEFV